MIRRSKCRAERVDLPRKGQVLGIEADALNATARCAPSCERRSFSAPVHRFALRTGGYPTARAIGVLRLEFVPEPPSGLIILAGAGLLGALYQRRTR